MIEIWIRDEYGQSSIQGRVPSLNDAIKKGKELLESHNTDNALTLAEKDKNWECFLPISHENSNLIYGGKVRGNVDFFFNPENGSIVETKSAKILLGNKNNKEWYASDHKNKEINSLTDNLLNNKSFIFFKKV